MSTTVKIGLAGTGFIAEGFAKLIVELKDMTVVSVLTRRDIDTLPDIFRKSFVTNDVNSFLDNVDCVVECSGDPIYATDTIKLAFDRKLPVITMNSELQVLTGSWLADKGVLSEAEGDQPGSEAILAEELRAMGFTPVLYGNIKGYLNHNPSEHDMRFWSDKQKISVEQVTSFTDGTKIQIEQTLVANAFGANLTKDGMHGVYAELLEEGAGLLLNDVDPKNFPISDYLLAPKLPAGVFIIATHNQDQKSFLKYYKMGDGPYYTFMKPFHLCHFEIPKTIRRVMSGQGVLLNNSSNPTIQVFSIAKKQFNPGDRIVRATGSFIVRGEASRIVDHPNCVPIGLLANAIVKNNIDEGSMITFDDVELPESTALSAWKEILKKVLEGYEK